MKIAFAGIISAALLILSGCTITNNSDTCFFPAPQTSVQTTVTTAQTEPPISTTASESTTTSTVIAAETTAVSTSESALTETTASAVSEETAEADIDANAYNADLSEATEEWMLLLVNPEHPIEEYEPPELMTLSNGVQIDARIYPPLQEMYDAMFAAGYAPFTREGFRTFADQQEIMEARIARHIAEGYSQEAAKLQAEKYVAIPGKSEHQTGLAVDINASDGNSWALYGWLSQHAYEYGFILRYPQGAEGITGYQYEPWHYRYVGKAAAAEITAKNITLEEYLS